MSSTLLRVESVAHSFGGQKVIAPCSFELRKGEVVAIIGPSGIGKTTLLRIFSGLIQPHSGKVMLHDQTVLRGDQRIAMVFQDYALFPWRTAQRNVEYPLQVTGTGRALRKEMAHAALAQVGLADSAHLYPVQMSGGMKQRVALARAIVARPALMLLDEPLSALDEITRRQLQDQLSALFNQIGCAVLLVTHNLNEAVRLADRVLVMNGRPCTIIADVRLDAGTSIAAQVSILQSLIAGHPNPMAAEIIHQLGAGIIA